MDAIQMLKQEHEQAKKTSAEIEPAAADARAQLWKKLKPELKVHDSWRKIGELEPSDSKWMGKVKKLRETLDHHIQEEESDVWPRIQRVFGPGQARSRRRADGHAEAPEDAAGGVS